MGVVWQRELTVAIKGYLSFSDTHALALYHLAMIARKVCFDGGEN